MLWSLKFDAMLTAIAAVFKITHTLLNIYEKSLTKIIFKIYKIY